jgi:hypothetical protein
MYETIMSAPFSHNNYFSNNSTSRRGAIYVGDSTPLVLSELKPMLRPNDWPSVENVFKARINKMLLVALPSLFHFKPFRPNKKVS